MGPASKEMLINIYLSEFFFFSICSLRNDDSNTQTLLVRLVSNARPLLLSAAFNGIIAKRASVESNEATLPSFLAKKG